MMVADASRMPCLSEMLMSFPVSHEWIGTSFHTARSRSVVTVEIERKRLKKKAGSAWTGERSGLTLSSTTRSDVTEKSAERMMPKRRELMRGLRTSGFGLRDSDFGRVHRETV